MINSLISLENLDQIGSLKSKIGAETGALGVLSSDYTVIESILLKFALVSDLIFRRLGGLELTLAIRKSPTTRRYRIAPKLQVSALIVIC